MVEFTPLALETLEKDLENLVCGVRDKKSEQTKDEQGAASQRSLSVLFSESTCEQPEAAKEESGGGNAVVDYCVATCVFVLVNDMHIIFACILWKIMVKKFQKIISA